MDRRSPPWNHSRSGRVESEAEASAAGAPVLIASDDNQFAAELAHTLRSVHDLRVTRLANQGEATAGRSMHPASKTCDVACVAPLLCYHTNLVCENKTTNEEIKSPYGRANPFHAGWRRNCNEACCVREPPRSTYLLS